MAAFVALKAELGVTCERLMRVLATQNAVEFVSLIWTLPRHVPKTMAIVALDGHVFLFIVPHYRLLDLG